MMILVATAAGAQLPNIAADHKKPVPRAEKNSADENVRKRPNEYRASGNEALEYGICQYAIPIAK